jgi:hypothetical protein
MIEATNGRWVMAEESTRCPWAVKFGVVLNTRCLLEEHHNGWHEGPGLAEFPYQKVNWFTGDRREYQTGREDASAWEEE